MLGRLSKSQQRQVDDVRHRLVASRVQVHDSTGAITGNIVGALNGAASLPAEWVVLVELRDVIETLSGDLAAIVDERHDPDALAQRMWDRYPGW